MPNYGYHLARAEGRLTESLYHALLPVIVRRRVECVSNIPIDVFSYSGQRRLAEQAASIRSFLKNAGRPHRYVIVTDGTYSEEAIELLRRVDHCVCVENVPMPPSTAPASFASYLSNHATGKQLALIMSLPQDRPALYVDSDIRFFPAAHELLEQLRNRQAPAYYLPDCGFSGDERLLDAPEERANPVNTGMLLMLRPLDWSIGIDRFLGLPGDPNFFTNQTITHLVMHANGAQPLDPEKYILRLDDQFVYRDQYAGAGVVSRHYVEPVRHKFWTSLAR